MRIQELYTGAPELLLEHATVGVFGHPEIRRVQIEWNERKTVKTPTQQVDKHW